MGPNDADRMANSVDPDQTAPLGAVWSGSALFAQTCLSENLGSLRYTVQILVQLLQFFSCVWIFSFYGMSKKKKKQSSVAFESGL